MSSHRMLLVQRVHKSPPYPSELGSSVVYSLSHFIQVLLNEPASGAAVRRQAQHAQQLHAKNRFPVWIRNQSSGCRLRALQSVISMLRGAAPLSCVRSCSHSSLRTPPRDSLWRASWQRASAMQARPGQSTALWYRRVFWHSYGSLSAVSCENSADGFTQHLR